MSEKKVAIKLSTLEGIGDAVREKEGSTEPIPVNALADRIGALQIGGGENKFLQLADRTITEVTAEDLSGITQIGTSAFDYCTSLTSAIIPNNITSIGNRAFYYCASLKTLEIGEGVTQIGSEMCNYCSSLTSIIIPGGVTNIGDSVFNSCRSLKSVVIGEGVKTIGFYMFQNCYELTSVTLPNTITSIQNYAFAYCTQLRELTIPSSIKNIGGNALNCGNGGIYKATFTFLGTTPPSLNSSAFNKSYLNKIIVPKGCGDAYKTATNWANFADYIEEATE